jgi:hypothetical protein
MSNVDIADLAEQAARLGFLTHEQVCARLLLMIARNQSYLERRARRGVRTPTDEALAIDCAVAARAIELLERG